jgi:predicted MPP superfamily phosphohydrolase
MRARTIVPLTVGGLASATLGYAAGVERRAPRLRRVEVPLLAPNAEAVRILHVSDLHLTPGQRWKIDWVRSLARLAPDFVIDTGDNLAHDAAVPSVLRALEPLLTSPGAFVPGSNDYYGPRWKNPASYLFAPDGGRRVHGEPLPWGRLRDALAAAGWVDLTNHRELVKVGDTVIDLAGIDDPHLGAERYDAVAGAPDPRAAVALGLVHAPYPHAVGRFAADGFGLVLAGHTHGGQLRVPGYGALVTNCGLDRWRARGLSQWAGGSWLHVSAGLGTSPYAPVRFCCPPEATMVTLVPRSG